MFKGKKIKFSEIFSFWRHKKRPAGEITPKTANEMQKKSYQDMIRVEDSNCTPPYTVIAAQLDSPVQQVFEAAAYYLCTIAASQARHRQAIVKILEAYRQNHANTPQRIEFVENMMVEKQLANYDY